VARHLLDGAGKRSCRTTRRLLVRHWRRHPFQDAAARSHDVSLMPYRHHVEKERKETEGTRTSSGCACFGHEWRPSQGGRAACAVTWAGMRDTSK